MSLLEIARSRYSCRDYSPKPVEKSDLDYIMECVRMAPSAVNRQPWQFYALSAQADLEKVAQCYRRDWLKTAPMVIIACVDHAQEWVRFDGKAHGIVDVSIAVEHLCLAATERGLATCWVCNFDAALCKELFLLPDNLEPAVLIPLGCPRDEVAQKKRKEKGEIFTMR